MKPIFHVLALSPLVTARLVGRPGGRRTAAKRRRAIAPSEWLSLFTPWHPAPFLQLPQVAERPVDQGRTPGFAPARVRRGDLLLHAERLRTLGL
jgi:hypothetical protein